MRYVRVAIALALLMPQPAAARDLEVPPGKGWKHAETGVILMAQLADLPRTKLTDATQSEHDVVAQYEAPDDSVTATIYIYHPAIADVSLWFDRSRMAIETRRIFRDAAPASADPVSFAVGGATAASSLRQTYANAGGPYRSTSLAVVPVGDWIVTVRLSAKTLTADQLDARLLQIMTTIRWPAPGSTLPTVVPIRACATTTRFTKAKFAKASGADVLMTLLGATLGSGAKASTAAKVETKPEQRKLWCRDGEPTLEYGVYRTNDDRAGYTLALYDAGRAITVYPSIMGQADNSGAYAVTLTDVDGTVSTYPNFTSMPAPKQAWDLIAKGKSSGTAKGNAITLDAKALK